MNDFETLRLIREFEIFVGDPGMSSRTECNLPMIESTPRLPGIVIGTLRFDEPSGDIVITEKKMSDV